MAVALGSFTLLETGGGLLVVGVTVQITDLRDAEWDCKFQTQYLHITSEFFLINIFFEINTAFNYSFEQSPNMNSDRGVKSSILLSLLV